MLKIAFVAFMFMFSHSGNLRVEDCTVIDFENDGGIVVFESNDGNIWDGINTLKNPCGVGDIITVMFDDNGTKEIKSDDIIIGLSCIN